MTKTHRPVSLMPKPSLLEQAKNITIRNTNITTHSQEEIELALAWVAGEVALTQVARVMKTQSTSAAYPFLATCLRQWMNEGKK